jgi:hypothetical protein
MIATLEGDEAGVERVDIEVAMVAGDVGSEALWRLM